MTTIVTRTGKGSPLTNTEVDTNFTNLNSAKLEAAVTSVAALTIGTTGTDLSSTVANGTTTPVISLQVPTASAANRGALSAADWTTFNNKQPAGSYLTAVTADAPLSGSGTSGSHLVIATANTTTTGAISSTDWNTFNGKQAALVSGTSIKTVNGTTLLGSGDVGVGVTSVTGTAPVVSSGGATPAISMAAATTSVSGYLTSTDWNTFNGKQAAGTYVTSVSGTAPVVSSGGTAPAISMAAASTTVSGYLTSTDWNTFNGKQPAGSYVTSGGALGTPSSGTLTNCTFPTLNQSTTGSAATFTSTTQNSQFNSIGVGTAASATAGEIRAINNITAFYSSDQQFKENVAPIAGALSAVESIGGKTFDWTDAYLEAHGGVDGYFVQKEDFGVIAQDVRMVFPLAVRTREDGSLAVDYAKLVALAFAAIVELNEKVKVLENK